MRIYSSLHVCQKHCFFTLQLNFNIFNNNLLFLLFHYYYYYYFSIQCYNIYRSSLKCNIISVVFLSIRDKHRHRRHHQHHSFIRLIKLDSVISVEMLLSLKVLD
jgi:hypothetical protein